MTWSKVSDGRESLWPLKYQKQTFCNCKKDLKSKSLPEIIFLECLKHVSKNGSQGSHNVRDRVESLVFHHKIDSDKLYLFENKMSLYIIASNNMNLFENSPGLG